MELRQGSILIYFKNCQFGPVTFEALSLIIYPVFLGQRYNLITTHVLSDLAGDDAWQCHLDYALKVSAKLHSLDVLTQSESMEATS